MSNLKSKTYHLVSKSTFVKASAGKKGEIVTLLTLGLVVVGAVITIGSSFFVNRTKNLASNPKAQVPCEINQRNCMAVCGSYSSCSSSCAKQYNVPDEGTADRICINVVTSTPKPAAPTNTPPIPTSSSNGCLYPNSRECSDDCYGDCSICTDGRYKCVAKVSTPTPTRFPTPTNIPAPTRSSTTCPYSCQKYNCSSDYTYKAGYSCSGFDTVCCEKSSIIPTAIPTPTRSVDSLFIADCRCVNGIWSGGGCDGWQRGKSCLSAGLSECKKNSQSCSGAGDTSCCSGYCVPSYYGYYCQSSTEVAKGCTSQTTKCDGNYLMKCINGAWIKDKSCSSCQQSPLGANCVMLQLTPIAETGTGGIVNNNIDCFNKGAVQMKGEQCFACYLTDKTPGKMVEVSSDLCQKVTSGQLASVSPADILLNAVSTADQYQLRQNAFDIYQGNSNIPVVDKGVAWLMEQADSLTYYTFGQLPRIFGGEAQSSMGNYYTAQMQANAVAAAEGQTRTVNIGQALTTGAIGGYQYANGLLFGLPDGALNLVTGGRTKNWEANTLTALYGENESEAAMKTIEAGADITNIVAILVPVGKGLSAVGGKMTTVATTLEQAGQAGFRSVILKGGGGITTAVGKGFQIISPETWAAGFIKAAPVTTFLEGTSASIGRLRPVVAASTKVTEAAASVTESLATIFPKTFEVASTVGKTTTTVGRKVVDFFIPKSALTYTSEEAAGYLARDINLGIVQPDDVARRLAERYRQSFVNSNQIANFTDQLMGTGVDEQVVSEVKNDLLINLQEQLARRAQSTTFGERLINIIQPDKDEVKVIGDLHSDVSASQQMLADLGFIDPRTGKPKNGFGVILGDYFGKTSQTLVDESATPGYDILKNAVNLQEETSGAMVALAGNWEPRVAYATRLEKLSQLANEAMGRGDEAYVQTLLKDNGYSSLQALDDEIRNFLKLNKPATGRMPLSHAEVDFLAQNSDEVGGLMGKLNVMARMPDGSVFQHVDTAEPLRYVFNSVEEIEVLALTPESKAALIDIFNSRGNSQAYLSPNQIRELNLALTQLGLTGDSVIERINQNTARILEDGMTRLDDPVAKQNLLALEKDMGKDLAFYQTPDVLVEFANIFSQNGDLRLVHGHSPINTISDLLGKSPQSGFVELANGVYTLADNPNISIYGADVNISRGMRIRGPNNAFLEVINGVMQVTDETVLSPALSGPRRVVTNPYDPAYLLLQKFKNLWFVNRMLNPAGQN